VEKGSTDTNKAVDNTH